MEISFASGGLTKAVLSPRFCSACTLTNGFKRALASFRVSVATCAQGNNGAEPPSQHKLWTTAIS